MHTNAKPRPIRDGVRGNWRHAISLPGLEEIPSGERSFKMANAAEDFESARCQDWKKSLRENRVFNMKNVMAENLKQP
jgi:hypothetical protein